jgi:hypothetical protein
MNFHFLENKSSSDHSDNFVGLRKPLFHVYTGRIILMYTEF